ncbi:MAG: 3-hydroxyacyl-ACP dehydratase FabZ family protein [Pirellulaceae bacterium]
MTLEQIHAAIPHRAPMLLVDEIVEQSDDCITCRKTFRDDEYFFQGHYPGYPLVPGVILCESGMQAGAILLARFVEEGGGVPVATRLGDVKFKKMVRPGDVIEMQVTLNERLADAFFLTARVTCGGKLAARFDFACTLAKVQA